jgi:fructokinase
MSTMEPIYGAIEAGGTKFICAVGDQGGQILKETRFPTTSPDETYSRALEFFVQYHRDIAPISSIGIASFGPIDLHRDSPEFGHILATSKPGWTGTDVFGYFQESLDVPIGFDTDVNGAALGEWRWGAAKGLETFVYLTIGTGIGGGGLVRGVPHDREQDPFKGVCPFHGDCFEGLASGPALEQRYGAKAESLDRDHPAWKLEAHYIALALQIYICTLSPQRIILGGGVMEQMQLYPLVREKTLGFLNGYIALPQIVENIDDYIVPPALAGRAGILGALVLAQQAIGHEAIS